MTKISAYDRRLREDSITKVRRAALGAMISQGGVPEPFQFARAGLPPLYRASAIPDPALEDHVRNAPAAKAWRAQQRQRLTAGSGRVRPGDVEIAAATAADLADAADRKKRFLSRIRKDGAE